MSSQPHPSKQAVSWRLRRSLVERLRVAAETAGEQQVDVVIRAIERELARLEGSHPNGG